MVVVHEGRRREGVVVARGEREAEGGRGREEWEEPEGDGRGEEVVVGERRPPVLLEASPGSRGRWRVDNHLVRRCWLFLTDLFPLDLGVAVRLDWLRQLERRRYGRSRDGNRGRRLRLDLSRRLARLVDLLQRCSSSCVERLRGAH